MPRNLPQRERWVGLVLAVLATGSATGLAACRGSRVRANEESADAVTVPSAKRAGIRPSGSASDDPPPAPVPGEPPVAPPGETPPAPPAPPPETPDEAARRLSSDAARFANIEREKREVLVRQKLAEAKALESRAEYAAAEQALLQARDLSPTNAEVSAALARVQQAMSRRGPSAAGALEELRRAQEIRIEEQRTTAQKYYNLGRMALDKGDWDGAIENLQQALMIIESSPLPIDWRRLKPDAENALAEAQRAKKEQARLDIRRATERTLGELASAEERRLIDEMQRLDSLMAVAVQAFERGDFEIAEANAQRVLDAQPDNLRADELVRAAQSARHDRIAREQIKDEQLRFLQWRDMMEETKVLEHKILRWPSQKFWDQITAARAAQRTVFGAVKLDPNEAALAAKLKTTTVNLSVQGRPFREVLQTLQIQTGVNLYLDPRIASEVGDTVIPPIEVEGVSLEQALNMLKSASPEGTIWVVRGNVVQFTKKEFVKYNLTLKQHPVADLTAGLTDFIPPHIDLVTGDQVNDEANPLFGGEGEETIKPFGTIDELIDLIKNAVGTPDTWSLEGTSIVASGTTAIIVKHTSETQGQVARFLNDLRAFAGIVVTVETRFLQVSDDFLRDVGVDFRGLGTTGNAASIVNLDDVTNGLTNNASAGRDNAGPGLPAGAALNPAAGAYFGDGNDGDFRGRTENIFDRALGSVFGGGGFLNPLSSLGGATFTLNYLDDSQYNAIVKAVEKTQRGRTLTAPTITVYNTQRANVTVVNQLSYISDFDVEVAQSSFIADPIIGVIQDGLTLDVRPTVSNDRRYITLELQPTVAKLVEPIPTFSTTLGSSFSPVIIQLPELRLQQARTTVRIPDGGSILIGGLKNIAVVDRQSEIPLIAKIPLLSFLFSRKGRSDEMSNLMILVRATITDLQEEEIKQRGR
jgi:general secretion pathway protein D